MTSPSAPGWITRVGRRALSSPGRNVIANPLPLGGEGRVRGWSRRGRVSAHPHPGPLPGRERERALLAGGVLADGTGVADQLEQIPVGIEEVEALVIAPVDRRVVRDPALGEEAFSEGEVAPGDLEGVV